MAYAKEQKDIKCVVIKIIVEDFDQRGGKHQLRLVDWEVDGKRTGVKLEKRDFWVSQEGEERMGKAKGLTLGDLKSVYSKWDEVQSLMLGKPQPTVKSEDTDPFK
jgi:hypothetical protein